MDVLLRMAFLFHVLQAMGTAKPSLTTNLLEEAYRKGTLDEDEGDIRDAAAGLYGGMCGTTASQAFCWILTDNFDNSSSS